MDSIPEECCYKRLNEAVLRLGDIILTTTSAPLSKVIRKVTQSDISHAMIYVEDRSVIDATGEGVHARNTQRLLYDEKCSVHVLRLQVGTSEPQLKKVVTFLRSHIGTEYSFSEAIKTRLGDRRKWSNKQFCSRLVAQAFASANIQLVSNHNYCSPADLLKSNLLVSVSGATIKVTAEYMAFFNNQDDTTRRMREATNKLLNSARLKKADIQTFDDLHRYLLNHPQQDNYFCRALSDSGYLSIWRLEREKNPWQYDLTLMSVASIEKVEDYCLSVLESEDIGPNRFIVNRAGYLHLYKQYGLQFFGKMAALYEHLAKLHHQRVDVATEWLESTGQLIRSAPGHLTPHTKEWFSAMEQWDPPKAIMTREVLKLSGRIDVCSICGDDSASDYYLERVSSNCWT